MSEQLSKDAEACVVAAGTLAKSLVSRDDSDAAQKVVCAGEKHSMRSETALKACEANLKHMCSKVDEIQVSCSPVGAMRQQLEATLAQIP